MQACPLLPPASRDYPPRSPQPHPPPGDATSGPAWARPQGAPRSAGRRGPGGGLSGGRGGGKYDLGDGGRWPGEPPRARAVLTSRGPTSSTLAFSMAGRGGSSRPPVAQQRERAARAGRAEGNERRRAAIGSPAVTCRGEGGAHAGPQRRPPRLRWRLARWRLARRRERPRGRGCVPLDPRSSARPRQLPFLFSSHTAGPVAREVDAASQVSWWWVCPGPLLREPAGPQRRARAPCQPRAACAALNPTQCALRDPPAFVSVGRVWQRILLPALFRG